MRRISLVVTNLIFAAAANAAGKPPPFEELVAAERAFAKRCGEIGIRGSFLEFFAPDGINFAPTPGNAKERFEKRPKETGPPMKFIEWGPAYAEIAPRGDLGWTTGPSVLVTRAGSPERQTLGHYFSLWRRQSDGNFKVVLDLGIESPPAPIPASTTALGPATPSGSEQPATGPNLIRAHDEAFCTLATANVAAAYANRLFANALVLREGRAPLVGEAAWRPWAKALPGVMTCAPMAAFSSDGPGFGYTYGEWQRRDRPEGPVIEKGFYARVWRLDSVWRIAADVAAVAK